MGKVEWWKERLQLDDDWNSLPDATRATLLNKFKRYVDDIAEFELDKKTIEKLIRDTNVSTVFNAVLEITAIYNNPKINKFVRRAELCKLVYGTTKVARGLKLHKEPRRKKKRKPPISLEAAKLYHPYNFVIDSNANRGRERRAVVQMDDDGVFIRRFPSITVAAKYVDDSPANIHRACNGTSNKCAGFRWSYYKKESNGSEVGNIP